jgi:plasmid replication initiation protein
MSKTNREKNILQENTCLVVKSNKLIEANYRLSTTEQRIIFSLCQNINRSDGDFKEYVFKISDFLELINVKDKSKYSTIPKICSDLMKRTIKIEDEKEILVVSWLSSAKYRKGNGEVILRFDPNLKPYLLQLKGNFTKLDPKEFYQLRSSYAQRMYELLKEYENIGKITYQIQDLRRKLGILDKEYKLYGDFRRKVIEVAQEELKQSTLISFDFEPIKVGKKVDSLRFNIFSSEQKQSHVVAIDSSEESYTQAETIEYIKSTFKNLYGGNLVDKFIHDMINKKGIDYLKNCLTNYKKHIKGRNIENIGGDFYTFVTKGYEKPIARKGNIPAYANFEQREYDEEYYEKFYTNLNKID